MSNWSDYLSGYDSEAVGFASITDIAKTQSSSSTQTTEYGEAGIGCQTTMSKDCGTSCEKQIKTATETDYIRLNAFLNRVCPAMMEQLDQNEQDNKPMNFDSNSSEDEEGCSVRIFQEINVSDTFLIGGGDEVISILSLSWSSAGNSFAVSIGRRHHENWCSHDGLIRIYTVKQHPGDKFSHLLDINVKNCVSVVKYHSSVAGILAYGTTAGEILVKNMSSSGNIDQALTSPSGCHGSKRVTALQWAENDLANKFLTIFINTTGRRRKSSDQVLISSGSDGQIHVWRINVAFQLFDNIVCYAVARATGILDINCFDFVQSYPLQVLDEQVPDDVFVVGAKDGNLALCKISPPQQGTEIDPVEFMFKKHNTCVLNIEFNYQRPGVFISLSIDSEIRLYNVNQTTPIKIFHTDIPISCHCSFPLSPGIAVLGVSPGGVVLYNVMRGKRIQIGGLEDGDVTTVAINKSNMLAAGDMAGKILLWELPSPQLEDIYFD